MSLHLHFLAVGVIPFRSASTMDPKDARHAGTCHAHYLLFGLSHTWVLHSCAELALGVSYAGLVFSAWVSFVRSWPAHVK